MRQQSEDVEATIRRLGDEWVRAERHGDTRVLSQHFADDFIGVGPRGFLLTKEQWLERLETGDLTYETLTWDDVHVRIYGDAAIAIGVQTSKAAYKGVPIEGRFRETHIYVREDGRWRLAGLQLSPMAGPA